MFKPNKWSYRAVALTVIAQAAIVFVATVAPASTPWAQGYGGASNALPQLGDGSEMAPSAERRLGDRIARELYRDPDYVDDPVIMEYVQSIWLPLLRAARLRGELPRELDEAFAWEILLGRDRTVNAFALPGAYLGLHLGLVSVVTSRDELASVLAHELSHVTQRHISRMMSRQSGQAPWLIGAMILGVLAASKSANAGNAAIAGSQAVAAQTQLNFSRDMEREADRVGFGVMTQAGFEPQGFVGMFEKLQQASRLNDTGGFPYLRSHPLTTERMADMQSRVPPSAGAKPGQKTPPSNDFEQAMLAARARVLSNSGVDDLRKWSAQTEPVTLGRLGAVQQGATLYGAVFAAIKLRELGLAQELVPRLMGLVRGDAAAWRLTRLLAAELALAQNDGARALDLLLGPRVGAKRPMEVVKITSRAELFLVAQASLLVNQPTDVTQALQAWVADHPGDAQAWQRLASAYAAQGRVLGSIRAEAEVNVAQLDFPAGLARLKAAQDLARTGAAGVDHIEASIVDTRARQLGVLVREQAQER